MTTLRITPQAIAALKEFELPETLNFGQVIAPVMIEADYENGSWGELTMLEFGPLKLNPAAKVFHYAQEIFEGMKAYYIDNKGPYLFRPEENLKRFNFSGKRMAMPEIPTELFMDAIEGITLACKEIIPNQSGDSLYIRPIMIATEESLGIRPSTKYKFIVMASPSGSYFSGGPLKVLVEREFTRASAGGTGNAKTGGNYAKSMQANLKAKELNLDQTLWLDSQDKTLIEELSGMNFFAVINGVLVTPQTSDTILDGITRKSLIEIAKKLNIPFEIQKIKINELYNKIESGECSELFSCGTAAIITPIASLHEENGKIYSPKHDFGPIAQKLRFELLGIQEGQIEDTFNWTVNLSEKALDL